jgi:site-specific DNA-cytosine methylase
MTNSVTKRAVDLFCGCGGISVGARLAGYDIVAGLDVEKNYISSFRHNFPKAHTVTDSIISLSAKDFAASVGIECGELDLLAGGPPCQGFSKNVPRKHRYLDDPKNLLVKSFLEYAEYLRPRVILMENVAEMKNGFDGQYTDEVVSRLESFSCRSKRCRLWGTATPTACFLFSKSGRADFSYPAGNSSAKTHDAVSPRPVAACQCLGSYR